MILLPAAAAEAIRSAYLDPEGWGPPGPSSSFARCFEQPLMDWWLGVVSCKHVSAPVGQDEATALIPLRGAVNSAEVCGVAAGGLLLGGVGFACGSAFASFVLREFPLSWNEFPVGPGEWLPTSPPIFRAIEIVEVAS